MIARKENSFGRMWVALKRAVFEALLQVWNLLGAGVLGDGLGSLTDGVLGQLSRQKETDSSLDLSAGDGGPPVVVGQTGSFSSDALKDIIDKAVHDIHGLAGDSSVRMYLLQHLVDVDRVGFPPPPAAFLVSSTLGLGLGGGLLGSLRGSGFWWHLDYRE